MSENEFDEFRGMKYFPFYEPTFTDDGWTMGMILGKKGKENAIYDFETRFNKVGLDHQEELFMKAGEMILSQLANELSASEAALIIAEMRYGDVKYRWTERGKAKPFVRQIFSDMRLHERHKERMNK